MSHAHAVSAMYLSKEGGEMLWEFRSCFIVEELDYIKSKDSHSTMYLVNAGLEWIPEKDATDGNTSKH